MKLDVWLRDAAHDPKTGEWTAVGGGAAGPGTSVDVWLRDAVHDPKTGQFIAGDGGGSKDDLSSLEGRKAAVERVFGGRPGWQIEPNGAATYETKYGNLVHVRPMTRQIGGGKGNLLPVVKDARYFMVTSERWSYQAPVGVNADQFMEHTVYYAKSAEDALQSAEKLIPKIEANDEQWLKHGAELNAEGKIVRGRSSVDAFFGRDAVHDPKTGEFTAASGSSGPKEVQPMKYSRKTEDYAAGNDSGKSFMDAVKEYKGSDTRSLVLAGEVPYDYEDDPEGLRMKFDNEQLKGGMFQAVEAVMQGYVEDPGKSGATMKFDTEAGVSVKGLIAAYAKSSMGAFGGQGLSTYGAVSAYTDMLKQELVAMSKGEPSPNYSKYFPYDSPPVWPQNQAVMDRVMGFVNGVEEARKAAA